MATYDWTGTDVIPNGSGSAVRADLNDALLALFSQNSSATAPPETVAYMPWADTANGLYKIRNAANSDWITLYQLDGEWSTIALEDGTAAAPSLYFKDSGTDTGLYSPGADQVAISTNGTGRLFVDASGNVGLGTSTPSNVLEVSSASNSYIRSTTTTNSVSGIFGAYTNSVDIGSTSSHALNFYTAGVNRATLDTSGRLGVGTTSPQVNLHLKDATNPRLRFEQNNSSSQQQIESSAGNFVFTADVTNAISGAASFIFNAGTNERARITSSGQLLVGTSSDSGGALLQVNGDRIRVGTAKTPASATDTGTAGEICWDANYVYVCTATNTWKRSALSTW